MTSASRPVTPEESEQIKAGCMAYAGETDFILLDSNTLRNPAQDAELEWLMAWGCRERLEMPGDDLEAWENFLSRHAGQWSAGMLSYDLYHCLKAAGGRAAAAGNPGLYWWVPEHIVACAKGRLHLIGNPELPMPPPPAAGDFPGYPLTCRISREEYITQVEQLLAHIHRGDIYEVNYCMEFSGFHPQPDIHLLWQRLMQASPNPFSALVHTPDHIVFSASPERFLQKKGGRIKAYPMKGTRGRQPDAEADAAARESLRQDAKERSENIMIVDLVRNDLSRIALPGSVTVDELCGVYTFAQMHQMISAVSCEVPDTISPAQVVRHTFPMGSMTGAPKVKAIELIRRYEGSDRGFFSGSIGFVNPENDMDLSVVIRSLVYDKKTSYLSLRVGSAITARSNPQQEYEECLLKAAPVLRALGRENLIHL